jgi:hypothetical protein
VRLTLCLLTWNELEGCRIDVPKLPLDDFDEVYAIDAGSTDGTCEFLAAAGIPVYWQELPGYNGAYVCAFRQCTTDALVMFHPKGCIDPCTLRRFRPLFEGGYDLVIASRRLPGGRNEEDDRLLKPRKWFVAALGRLVSLLWRREGYRVRDVLHGYRGMRREAFFAMNPIPSGVSMDLEMVVRSYKRQTRRTEFPVEEAARAAGVTHFPAISTGHKLLRYLWIELSRP